MFESWPEMWGGGYPAYRTTLRKFLWFRTVTGGNAPEFKTVTGKIVSFITQRIAPLKIEAALEPIQDLHGYENPWPAGGGVNFLPPMVDGTYEGNGAKAVVSGGIATLSGTTTSSGNAFSIPLASPVTVPASFYYHCGNSAANASVGPALENSQNTSQNLTASLSPTNRIYGAIADKEGQTYDRIRFWLPNGITLSGTYAPMFCLDGTERSFSPYSNICPISGHSGADIYVEDEYDAQADPTVQISFGSTVYGCTLVVNEDGTGSVVADRASVEYDGSDDEDWSRYTSGSAGAFAMRILVSGIKRSSTDYVAIANYLKSANGSDTWGNFDNFVSATNNNDYLYAGINTITSKSAWKTYLASNPLQVVYKLATPITIALTPGEVNALLGNNTVWLDTGDDTEISVTYQSN